MRILILIHYTIHCTVHARCNQGAHIADMKQTWNISTRDMQPETNLEVLYPWFPLTKHRKHDDSHDRSDTYNWTKCGIQWIIPLTLLFITWVMMPAALLSEVRRTSSCLLTAREEDAGPRWTMQGNHCQCTVVSAVMGPGLDTAHSGIFLSIDWSTIHDLIMFVLYQLSKRGIWSQTLTCPLHSSVIK